MGYVFGEDQRGRGGCYHELTGKWQREFCGRSVSGWEVMARELKTSSCRNLFERAHTHKKEEAKS